MLRNTWHDENIKTEEVIEKPYIRKQLQGVTSHKIALLDYGCACKKWGDCFTCPFKDCVVDPRATSMKPVLVTHMCYRGI